MLGCSGCGSINEKIAEKGNCCKFLQRPELQSSHVKKLAESLSDNVKTGQRGRKKSFSLNQVVAAVRVDLDDKGLAETNLAYAATIH